MTENILSKLEEKIINLLSELEHLRARSKQLEQDNANLTAEKAAYTKKLQGMISLLDVLDASLSNNTENTMVLES